TGSVPVYGVDGVAYVLGGKDMTSYDLAGKALTSHDGYVTVAAIYDSEQGVLVGENGYLSVEDFAEELVSFPQWTQAVEAGKEAVKAGDGSHPGLILVMCDPTKQVKGSTEGSTADSMPSLLNAVDAKVRSVSPDWAGRII